MFGFVGRPAVRFGLSADPHPGQDARQLVGVEPDAVIPANVDYYTASEGKLAGVHQLAADRTLAVHRATLRVGIERRGPTRRGVEPEILGRQVGRGLLDQMLQDVRPQPEPGAAAALHQGHVADLPAAEARHFPADRAGKFRFLAGQSFRTQRQTAMMAELGPIAYPRETLRTDRIEVSFVEGEVGSAMGTSHAALLSRRAARRAADHRGVVPARPTDRNNRSAMAAEPAADRPSTGVELAMALWAGDEKSHGIGRRL